MKKNSIDVSLIDLGMAYRKAKVDQYYMGIPCLEKLLDYEEDLQNNLEYLKEHLLESKTAWFESEDFLGGWTLVPKSIDVENKKNGFIESDPQKKWEEICRDEPRPKVEFRLMAQPSIDFCVISALWISKVGYKYDEKLSSCAYGNRLRRQKNNDLNSLSLGSFARYLRPFSSWRDNGIRVMSDEVENGKSIVAITADVQSFYHELNPDFMLNAEFLDLIGLELENDERVLTELFINALKNWAQLTPLKKGLPVGLPASALIANMALIELDRVIQEEISPLYYGRYVDDIILVIKNNSEFQNRTDVWNWIISRFKNKLNWKPGNPKETIVFKPIYLKDSNIEFSNTKEKIFLLKGTSGKTLIDKLTKEIHERASEWRALPSLPNSAKDIALDLLFTTQENSEKADNLRKADALSLRLASFSIKLRDFEAYERDLSPSSWQDQRYAFLDAFIKFALVPPHFFDFYKYLHRVIKLATICEDFDILKKIIKRLIFLVGEISMVENITIKASEKNESKSEKKKTKEKEIIINKWVKQLKAIIEESICASFPPKLTKLGIKLWVENFTNKKEWALKDTDTELWDFQLDLVGLKIIQQQLFNHDLAHIPFRYIGLQKELISRIGIPRKKTVTFFASARLLLRREVCHGIDLISKQIKFNNSTGLPYGLLFSTRPFDLTEIYLIQNDPFLKANQKEINDSILALRGFTATGKMPRFYKTPKTPKTLIISRNQIVDKIRIAVASWYTNIDSWNASVKKMPDPDLTRYQRLNKLFNDLLQSEVKPHYIILPELSVPAKWFVRIAQKLHSKGISLICGIEYLHKPNSIVNNQVWVSMTHNGLGFPTMMIYRQDKQRPALGEEHSLFGLANLSLKPDVRWKKDKPPIIQHGDFQFAILICSELTNITNRSALRGNVDALFVPEWNRDTESFNSLVESAALDIHAYIIQCNDRKYGDSRIRAPYRDSWNRDIVRVKGGMNDYFVIGEIDVSALRQFQSNYRSPSTPFKPVPDGFIIATKRKTLPRGNTHAE